MFSHQHTGSDDNTAHWIPGIRIPLLTSDVSTKVLPWAKTLYSLVHPTPYLVTYGGIHPHATPMDTVSSNPIGATKLTTQSSWMESTRALGNVYCVKKINPRPFRSKTIIDHP